MHILEIRLMALIRAYLPTVSIRLHILFWSIHLEMVLLLLLFFETKSEKQMKTEEERDAHGRWKSVENGGKKRRNGSMLPTFQAF